MNQLGQLPYLLEGLFGLPKRLPSMTCSSWKTRILSVNGIFHLFPPMRRSWDDLETRRLRLDPVSGSFLSQNPRRRRLARLEYRIEPYLVYDMYGMLLSVFELATRP
jgi:hypothetical protein